MKKLILLISVLLISFNSSAQEKTYVNLYFGNVSNSDRNAHVEIELETFAKIHELQVERGELIGWDMWQLVTPGLENQETQFLYANIYTDHNKSRLWLKNWNEYVSKVTDDPETFNEKASKLIGHYTSTRDLFTVVLASEGDFNLKEGSYMVLNEMIVDYYQQAAYVDMETNTFSAWRANDPYLNAWALHKNISELGKNRVNFYTHDFYDNIEDIFSLRENVSELDSKSLNMFRTIDNIRVLKDAKIYRLIKSIR